MLNKLTNHKQMLTLFNMVVVFGLVFLTYLGLFDSGECLRFVLLAGIVSVLAIYKPEIVFVLLVGVIPIEIINIVPEQFGFNLRPYQLLVVALIFAIIVRKIFGLSKEKMFRWGIFDTLIAIFIGLSFISAGLSDFGGIALKQTLVVLSFGLLYFVVRYFVRTKEDLLMLFPILVSSGVVVGAYAILQNILFATGGAHMEVMPGRPNATFAEPDWLGMYMVFVLAVTLAYLYYNTYHKHLWKFFDIALFSSATIFFVTLIITVARSGWLGALGVIFVYSVVLVLQKKYKLFTMHIFWIASTVVLAGIVVWGFHLTNFGLFNRVQSTGSGLQEITISCVSNGQTQGTVPTLIEDVDELIKYNCRHINLEEIESEKSKGNGVFKIYRKDPNIEVRANVYVKTIDLIKQKPLLGYGWGSSGQLLGTDESGTPLNASNVFLEVILSIGFIGVGVLLAFGIMALYYATKALYKTKNMKQKSIAIFVLLGLVAIAVPNLFNAGLFLGFVWLFLGIVDGVRKI